MILSSQTHIILILFLIICLYIPIVNGSSSTFNTCPFYKQAFELAGLGHVYEFVVETDRKYANKSIMTSLKESSYIFQEEVLNERNRNIEMLQHDGIPKYIKNDLIVAIPETISRVLKRFRQYVFGLRRSVDGPKLPPLQDNDITLNRHKEVSSNNNDDNTVNNYIKIFDSFIDSIDQLTSKISTEKV